jgi:hypothetical protein
VLPGGAGPPPFQGGDVPTTEGAGTLEPFEDTDDAGLEALEAHVRVTLERFDQIDAVIEAMQLHVAERLGEAGSGFARLLVWAMVGATAVTSALWLATIVVVLLVGR